MLWITWLSICALTVAQMPNPSMEPLAGVWASVIVQTGVLGWLLLIHLPAKDKQSKEQATEFRNYVESKDQHITAITEKFLKTIEAKDLATVAMAEKYEAAMDNVIRHCREESELFRESRNKNALESSRANLESARIRSGDANRQTGGKEN